MIRWIDKINQNHPMVQGIQIIYKIDGTVFMYDVFGNRSQQCRSLAWELWVCFGRLALSGLTTLLFIYCTTINFSDAILRPFICKTALYIPEGK
jgi:hypothetical protein